MVLSTLLGPHESWEALEILLSRTKSVDLLGFNGHSSSYGAAFLDPDFPVMSLLVLYGPKNPLGSCWLLGISFGPFGS